MYDARRKELAEELKNSKLAGFANAAVFKLNGSCYITLIVTFVPSAKM
jgi:hypothetical protein